jgi:hypothetical protein
MNHEVNYQLVNFTWVLHGSQPPIGMARRLPYFLLFLNYFLSFNIFLLLRVTRAIILLVLTLHTNGKCFDGIQQQGLNFYFGISWVSLNYFFLYCRERFINQANQIYWFCIFIPKSQTNSKTKPLARFFLGPRFFKLHSWRRHRCHGCDLPGLPAHHLCSWRTWSPFALALVLSLSLSLSLSLAHKSTLAFIVMNLLLFVVDPGRSRKLSKKTQGQG